MQELKEPGCFRKLPPASHLLFSTSGTSTSKIGFSKPLIAGLVGTATRKSQHSTRLIRSKQEWRGANVCGFLTRLTHNIGNRPPPSPNTFVSFFCFPFP